ncbi:hypothetical protein PR003_g12850 [Phytophthora rubi]|uniref:RxLR effector protein n=1 Tax=Phytophthora rubi TaxID=129364 RepID=A0A6A3LVG4_9STRA|nr:hypothetical protein PR002_g12077 [Phytophthora rubi]KAE9026970.1 hypothetical protein PR001_g12078 [Phytophthora rubi]KAE9335773.1 hypothetical protein PR003_g12850 [Phytophthora rubi]
MLCVCCLWCALQANAFQGRHQANSMSAAPFRRAKMSEVSINSRWLRLTPIWSLAATSCKCSKHEVVDLMVK